MSKSEKENAQPREHRSKKKLRGWQKGLAVLSIVITVAGAGLMTYAAVTGEAPPPAAASSAGAGSNFASGFAPADPSAGGSTEQAEHTETDRLIDSTSGAVFRLGFGFFAGFAVAYALRTFVRMTLVAAGIAILGLMGLQYAGIITVDWAKISGGFDDFGTWITAQTRGFAGFITGYLPTFGAGLAGAFVGFRRL